jgi:hypothetical protein
VAVEIGTFYGGSTAITVTAMRHARRGKLWCIDPAPKLRINWDEYKDVAVMIEEPSPQAYDTVAQQIPGPIEFALIDGLHTYEQVIKDTMGLIPHLAGEAWLLYHDCAFYGVAKAIDHCLAEVPELSDGGRLCRYFNGKQWPGDLFGGLRLLYYRNTSRQFFDPPVHCDARSDSLPEALTEEEVGEVETLIADAVASGRTPIAVQGFSPRLAGLTPLLARYSDHIVAVVDDDPLLQLKDFLGWPVLSAAAAKDRGVRTVLILSPLTKRGKKELQVFDDLEGSVVSASFAGDAVQLEPLPKRNRKDPVASLAPVLLEGYERLLHRRFLLYGDGEFIRANAGRLMSSRPYPMIIGAISDDPDQQGAKLWGFPIVSLEQAGDLKPDAIVLCSPENESELAEKCQQSLPNVSVYRLLGPNSWNS